MFLGLRKNSHDTAPHCSTRFNSLKILAITRFRMRDTPWQTSSTVSPGNNIPGFSISILLSKMDTLIGAPF